MVLLLLLSKDIRVKYVELDKIYFIQEKVMQWFHNLLILNICTVVSPCIIITFLMYCQSA